MCVDLLGTIDDMCKVFFNMPSPLAPARPESLKSRGHVGGLTRPA
jgi:hypothetical protein